MRAIGSVAKKKGPERFTAPAFRMSNNGPTLTPYIARR